MEPGAHHWTWANWSTNSEISCLSALCSGLTYAHSHACTLKWVLENWTQVLRLVRSSTISIEPSYQPQADILIACWVGRLQGLPFWKDAPVSYLLFTLHLYLSRSLADLAESHNWWWHCDIYLIPFSFHIPMQHLFFCFPKFCLPCSHSQERYWNVLQEVIALSNMRVLMSFFSVKYYCIS